MRLSAHLVNDTLASFLFQFPARLWFVVLFQVGCCQLRSGML